MSENSAPLNASTRKKSFGSVEDFLKAVYTLQQTLQGDDERVATNALAEELEITAPSVTDMARRMVEAGYIDYQRYHGVKLTPQGEAVALRVIRRHRLIELYLVTELGYALHEVHDEAENLEHAVSDRFVDAIAARLDNPHIDPHGDPIPAKDGSIPRRHLVALSDLPLKTAATVSRFIAENSEMLQHILGKGFKLDARVEVMSRDPFEGPVTARINDQERIIGHNVAAAILVEVIPEA
ncbi:MAG: metal-dependent transcriptional regulator [bacterium]|nr:metal-dependent transcriptional regulator [bacterium]